MRYERGLPAVALLCGALLLAACSSIAPPTVTYDGLVLVPGSRFSEVYKLPDADLTHYDSFGLVPCEVAFRKNWMRDQNNTRMDLGSRVTQKDVDRIKQRLSEACDQYFREALQQPPPYRLVESFDKGEQVLVLRPAIINLDIAAPDIRTAGVQRSYTTEAGQMTLVLEQLLTTGGGWQDQLGGIMQGIKKRVIDGTASSAHAKNMSERVTPLAERAWSFAQAAGAQ